MQQQDKFFIKKKSRVVFYLFNTCHPGCFIFIVLISLRVVLVPVYTPLILLSEHILKNEIFVQCCVFVVVCLVEVCRPPTRSDTLCLLLLLLLLLLLTALVLDAAPNTLKNIFDGLSLHHFHCILDACIECHQMYPMTQTLIHRSKPNIFFVNQ